MHAKEHEDRCIVVLCANHLICLVYLFISEMRHKIKRKFINILANLLPNFLKSASEPLFSALSRHSREGSTGSRLPRAARGELIPLPASS